MAETQTKKDKKEKKILVWGLAGIVIIALVVVGVYFVPSEGGMGLIKRSKKCMNYITDDGTRTICEGKQIKSKKSGVAVQVKEVDDDYIQVRLVRAKESSMTIKKGQEYDIPAKDGIHSVRVVYLDKTEVSNKNAAEIQLKTVEASKLSDNKTDITRTTSPEDPEKDDQKDDDEVQQDMQITQTIRCMSYTADNGTRDLCKSGTLKSRSSGVRFKVISFTDSNLILEVTKGSALSIKSITQNKEYGFPLNEEVKVYSDDGDYVHEVKYLGKKGQGVSISLTTDKRSSTNENSGDPSSIGQSLEQADPFCMDTSEDEYFTACEGATITPNVSDIQVYVSNITPESVRLGISNIGDMTGMTETIDLKEGITYIDRDDRMLEISYFQYEEDNQKVPKSKAIIYIKRLTNCGDSAGGDGDYSGCIGDRINHNTSQISLKVSDITRYDSVEFTLDNANESFVELSLGESVELDSSVDADKIRVTLENVQEKNGKYVSAKIATLKIETLIHGEPDPIMDEEMMDEAMDDSYQPRELPDTEYYTDPTIRGY